MKASGCPALTSNVSSLPEAAGGPEAAVPCDPGQPAAIAAGLANAAAFSWEHTARRRWQAAAAF